MIDATFVEVPRQRNTREENAGIKCGNPPEESEKKPAKRRQKCVDARWAKKNQEKHYGYKNHVNVDEANKPAQSTLRAMRRCMTARDSENFWIRQLMPKVRSAGYRQTAHTVPKRTKSSGC